MCGIVGIAAQQSVKQDIYDSLTVLQHRGQDAAGIMTTDHKRVYLRKDCLLYTSPSPRDGLLSRMPSSA